MTKPGADAPLSAQLAFTDEEPGEDAAVVVAAEAIEDGAGERDKRAAAKATVSGGPGMGGSGVLVIHAELGASSDGAARSSHGL